MALKGRFETVRSFDRTRLSYATWGSGPAIVFANGIACTDTYWTHLVPAAVDAGFRAVFFDYRGHGRSGAPANPNEISVGSHARDLWAVADAAGVEDAVLVGHSMGVATILEAYRLQPERVNGLVALAGAFEHALSTVYSLPFGSYFLAVAELMAEPLPQVSRAVWRRLGTQTPLLRTFGRLGRMIGPNAENALMDEYLEQVAAMDPILLMRMFRCMQLHTARTLLPEIDTPTLVVAGSRDVMTPPDLAREMATLVPGAELEIIDGAAHTLPIDDPELVNRLVLDFAALAVEVAGPRPVTPRTPTDRSPASRTGHNGAGERRTPGAHAG